jgi:transcriptional regulator, ArsR family
MHIQFCEHGSRIYDFFNLFAHKEHILNRREEEKGYDDVCYTLFLSLLNKAKDMLEQFEAYYYPGCALFGNFIPYLYYTDYQKEEDMLNDLAACDSGKLQAMILSSLLYNLKGIPIEKAEDLTPYMDDIRKNGMFTFLHGLSMTDNAKWRILCAWNDPESTRDSYIALMKAFLPLFLEEYALYRDEVKAYGLDLQKRIVKNGYTVISDMWKGIYDEWDNTEKYLSNASYLFISIGAAPLMSTGRDEGDKTKRTYVQGFHLEQGLQKLRQTIINNRERLVFFFKNLGDATRFQMLELIGKGLGTNKELAEALSLTTATVSYHLNYLFNANMILRTDKDGKSVLAVNKRSIKKTLDVFLAKL